MNTGTVANTASATAVTAATTVTENFLRYGRGAANRTFVGDLMRFHKFGEYRAGQEEAEIPLGSQFYARMESFCVGWQRWEDSRPVEQIMGPVAEGFVPPTRKTLGHLDKSQWESFDDGREKDPWAFANTLVLTSLDQARSYTFTTSSKGGIGALGTLALRFGEHSRQQPGETPVVELGRDSYDHPDYGEIRVPVFKIVSWKPTRDLPPIEGDSNMALTDESKSVA